MSAEGQASRAPSGTESYIGSKDSPCLRRLIVKVAVQRPPQGGPVGSRTRQVAGSRAPSAGEGFASLSRYSNPHKTHCQLGSRSIVLRSSCDCASRANESIPSPRHRAKTAPKERSIWLTCCTSLARRKQTGLCNGRLTSSLHNIIEVVKGDV